MQKKATNYKKFMKLENKLLLAYIIITVITLVMVIIAGTEFQFIMFSAVARLIIMIFLIIKYIEYKEKEKAIIIGILIVFIAIPVNNLLWNTIEMIIIYPGSIIALIRMIRKNNKLNN